MSTEFDDANDDHGEMNQRLMTQGNGEIISREITYDSFLIDEIR